MSSEPTSFATVRSGAGGSILPDSIAYDRYRDLAL